MASWNWPALINKISTDVNFINSALKALLKLDPTGIDDVPVDAKRLTEISNGNVQLQKYSGTEWSSVGKLNHDVDTLDGYHATQAATANNVAVRDANGKLAGDILGNAATATVANSQSYITSVANGGTGASTSAGARVNLAVPPISHKSTATTYGAGDNDEYGHVKLSDAVNSTSGVAGGIAATPAAAKSAYDKAVAGVNAAAAAQAAAGNAQTTANTAKAAAGNAQTTANTAKAVTDKVSTTPAAGKIPLAGSDGKIDKDWLEIPSGMPIGSIFSHLCSSTFTPDGCLPVDGAEYTKAQFSDFYTNYLASGKLLTCTYAEYSTAVSTYGACAKFALDTTNQKFKVPLLKDGDSITQAASVGEIGKSVKAGLPNVTGYIEVSGSSVQPYSAGGAFSTTLSANHGESYNPNGKAIVYSMSLSAVNPIYGNSTTVTDEQVRLRHFIVVANGTINQSMMDWSAWATGLAGKANNDLSNLTPAAKMSLLGILVMTGSITLNGTTNNTVVMTGIVPELALEVGDVIRINTGTYNKLHTVESITNNGSIIVNYEHAGNKGNGSLKLPNFTGQATVTRIAKWFNAPLGLGQAWVNVDALRLASTDYTNTTGRTISVFLLLGTTVPQVSVNGEIAGQWEAYSGKQGASAVVQRDAVYRGVNGMGGGCTVYSWKELR